MRKVEIVEIVETDVRKAFHFDWYSEKVQRAMDSWLEHMAEYGVTVVIGTMVPDRRAVRYFSDTRTICVSSAFQGPDARLLLHEYCHFLEGHAYLDEFNFGLDYCVYRENVVFGMERAVMELHGITYDDVYG